MKNCKETLKKRGRKHGAMEVKSKIRKETSEIFLICLFIKSTIHLVNKNL